MVSKRELLVSCWQRLVPSDNTNQQQRSYTSRGEGYLSHTAVTLQCVIVPKSQRLRFGNENTITQHSSCFSCSDFRSHGQIETGQNMACTPMQTQLPTLQKQPHLVRKVHEVPGSMETAHGGRGAAFGTGQAKTLGSFPQVFYINMLSIQATALQYWLIDKRKLWTHTCYYTAVV